MSVSPTPLWEESLRPIFQFLERALHAFRHLAPDFLRRESLGRRVVVPREEDEPYHGSELRAIDLIQDPSLRFRISDLRRKPEPTLPKDLQAKDYGTGSLI